jgi:hypothetical protein
VRPADAAAYPANCIPNGVLCVLAVEAPLSLAFTLVAEVRLSAPTSRETVQEAHA